MALNVVCCETAKSPKLGRNGRTVDIANMAHLPPKTTSAQSNENTFVATSNRSRRFRAESTGGERLKFVG